VNDASLSFVRNTLSLASGDVTSATVLASINAVSEEFSLAGC